MPLPCRSDLRFDAGFGEDFFPADDVSLELRR